MKSWTEIHPWNDRWSKSGNQKIVPFKYQKLGWQIKTQSQCTNAE